MNHGRLQSGLGVLLIALGSLPGLRHWMEAGMWRHMMLQFPLWMLAGALLVAGLSPRARRVIARWNDHGASGLVMVAIITAVLMVPRVLDLALLRMDIEVAKLAALLLAGAALRLSWLPAGRVLQFFFLGNVLAMMAVVGMLYIDSPVRLCNAYLLDDQERLGQWLTAVAALLATAWLCRAGWEVVQRDAEAQRRAATQAAATAAQAPARAAAK